MRMNSYMPALRQPIFSDGTGRTDEKVRKARRALDIFNISFPIIFNAQVINGETSNSGHS